MIPRFNVGEFCDQPWLPKILREAIFCCLNKIHLFLQPYKNAVDHWPDRNKNWAETIILDLGSGGGTHIVSIIEGMLLRNFIPPKFVLCDLYPNIQIWSELKRRYPEFIDFIDKPVDFNQIPSGFDHVMICSAFHHLSQEAAKDLIKDIIQNRQTLIILEFTQRSLFDLLLMLPSYFINIFFILLCTHTKKIAKLFSPLSALIVTMDGILSILRSYKPSEIRQMVDSLRPTHFYQTHHLFRWKRLPLLKSMIYCLNRRSL